jgi:hypothetical protein
MRSTVPTLITRLRLTMGDLAEWTNKSTKLVEVWQRGLYQPKPEDRARLVTEVRNHATTLLALADAVEREGLRKET